MRARSILALVAPVALVVVALSSASIVSADAPSIQARNKALVLRFEEEFKNKANLAIVDELMAPAYRAYGIGPVPLDRAGLRQLGKAVGAAFPDVHVTIDAVVVERDLVVTRCSVTGTHKGPFNGIPATGKRVKFAEMHMYRLDGGKIVEQWSSVDSLAILAQIGGLPPPRK